MNAATNNDQKMMPVRRFSRRCNALLRMGGTSLRGLWSVKGKAGAGLALLLTLSLVLPAWAQSGDGFGPEELAQTEPMAASSPTCSTANDSELVTHLTGSSSAAISGTVWGAQQFSFAGNRTLTGVFIHLEDTGSDVGSAVVSLYTDNGAGKPGTQIANTEVSVATSTIPASQTEVWFEFPQVYSYTASAVPHIVFRTSGGGTVNCWYDASTLYTGGTATSSSDSGANWNDPNSGFDYNFTIWGCE